MAAIALPLGLVMVAAFRAAADAMKRLLPQVEKRSLWHSALALWALGSAGALLLFGTALKATTHHRGLGGTTFAIVAVVVVLVLGLLAVRASQFLRNLFSKPSTGWALTGFAGVLLIMMLRPSTNAPGHAPGAVTLAVIDGLLFVALSWGASMITLPAKTTMTQYFAAIGASAILIVTGMRQLPRVANGGAEVRRTATIAAPILDRWHEYDPTLSVDEQTKGRTEVAPTPSGSLGSQTGKAQPSAMAAAASAQPEPVASNTATAKRVSKPDIVLVPLDSVSADHLGAYGYTKATSPNLDALAKQSIVFERAYAAGPEPRTGLSPLLTGRYLEQTSRDDRAWPTILEANKTLAERMRDAGYATGAVTSFRWLSEERGFTQGFDIFDETPFHKVNPEQHSTGEHAITVAIETYDKLAVKNGSVFLWVHLFDAHGRYLEHEGHSFGTEDVDRYDSEIAYMDEQLQRLIEHVQKGKRGSRTMIVVHGTHGEAFGEHGMSGHPGTVFEELIRIPLVIRVPWMNAKRVGAEVVSAIDIAPSILDVAQAADSTLPGQSLVGLADGSRKEDGSRGVLVSFMGMEHRPRVRAWVEPGFKLVVGNGDNGERIGLYDLSAKDAETDDVSAKRTEQAKRMKASMDSFLKEKVVEVSVTPKR